MGGVDSICTCASLGRCRWAIDLDPLVKWFVACKMLCNYQTAHPPIRCGYLALWSGGTSIRIRICSSRTTTTTTAAIIFFNQWQCCSNV